MTNGRNVRIYKENGGKRIENQSKARVSTRCLWHLAGAREGLGGYIGNKYAVRRTSASLRSVTSRAYQ
jgi:hypothetical protein